MESVSVRLPDDVAARVEEIAEQRGVSKSEAMRRLVVAGLERDRLEERVDHLEGRIERLEEPFWRRWL